MGTCFSLARRRDTKQVPIVPESFETRPGRIRRQRDTRAKLLKVFPTAADDARNTVICVPGSGNRKDFGVLAAKFIQVLDLAFEKVQCFPFYTYAEDGSNRRENITDWALEQFRERYGDRITKWAIFHYIYAVLHHPEYRQRYAANLRRELPRIPFVSATRAEAQLQGDAALRRRSSTTVATNDRVPSGDRITVEERP